MNVLITSSTITQDEYDEMVVANLNLFCLIFSCRQKQ